MVGQRSNNKGSALCVFMCILRYNVTVETYVTASRCGPLQQFLEARRSEN